MSDERVKEIYMEFPKYSYECHTWITRMHVLCDVINDISVIRGSDGATLAKVYIFFRKRRRCFYINK